MNIFNWVEFKDHEAALTLLRVLSLLNVRIFHSGIAFNLVNHLFYFKALNIGMESHIDVRAQSGIFEEVEGISDDLGSL